MTWVRILHYVYISKFVRQKEELAFLRKQDESNYSSTLSCDRYTSNY